jgi:hypothetical protein
MSERYLRAIHDSSQHIDAIPIDLWIENIFFKCTSYPKIFDLVGEEFNEGSVCAFRGLLSVDCR